MTKAHLKNKIVLITNPHSKNGEANNISLYVKSQLASLGLCVEAETTKQKSDCEKILKKHIGKCSLFVAIGGDGLVHELVNCLMKISPDEKPPLALIPAGTGNDYARSLNLSLKPSKAVEQLLLCDERMVDVGRCNSEYFMQTLSFGLDAAIALGTLNRRATIGKSTTRVFLEEGLYQLIHHLNVYDFNFKYSDSATHVHEFSGSTYMFAVQVGKTYGGGFMVCPKAEIDSGHFDVCYVSPKINRVSATALFLLAKKGHHTKFSHFNFLGIKEGKITIKGNPKIQIDGEPYEADQLNLSIVPKALKVLSYHK